MLNALLPSFAGALCGGVADKFIRKKCRMRLMGMCFKLFFFGCWGVKQGFEAALTMGF